MGSRVFVGFSSTDKQYYDFMKGWKANGKMDFDFINMQIPVALRSNNEAYIKGIIRERITNSGTFIQLIGEDTKSKHKYVRWEAEVAIEKNCRLICVNLNGSRYFDDRCPPILKNKGAMFIPFGVRIVKHTIDNFQKKTSQDWHWEASVYQQLGL